MFGLESTPVLPGSRLPFHNQRALYLANARSGISLLTRMLAPKRVWLPSYLCEVMIQAIVQNNAGVIRFYGVDGHLRIADTEWLASLANGDLVLMIDYFGFPIDVQIASEVKERGCWLLEDASQALLSARSNIIADFILYSPKKFIGVVDGGILEIYAPIDFGNIHLDEPPSEWWLKGLSAAILRREYDRFGGERQWFQLFREIDAEAPIGSYAMSQLSRILMDTAFDYASIAERRIRNYRKLANYLGEFALFPNLPEGVVPLGFPIRVRQRDRLRRLMFDHQIFPPVHWPIEAWVPQAFHESHRLASETLTLLCDQRYDDGGMQRQIDVVLENPELLS